MGSSKRDQSASLKKKEKRHVCSFCDARFSFPNKLRAHIQSLHSMSHKCTECDASFNRFNNLRTHMKVAHQLCHRCHLCTYSSSIKSEVKKHVIRNHENGVRCTIDGCTMTVAYNRLRKHIREQHSADGNQGDAKNSEDEAWGQQDDESEESVDNDGNSNEQSSTEIVCVDAMHYTCQRCLKQFNFASAARRHFKRVHEKSLKEKERSNKYKCTEKGCDRFFSCAAKLNDHLTSIHSKEDVADCETCDKKFKSRAQFATHLRRYHLVSIREAPAGYTLQNGS